MRMPQIHVLVIDYWWRRTGWVGQSLQNEKQASAQDVVCHRWCAHKHYLLDCVFCYGRRQKAIANSGNITLDKQKNVSWNATQIVVRAVQAATDRSGFSVLQVTAANATKGFVLHPVHQFCRVYQRFMSGQKKQALPACLTTGPVSLKNGTSERLRWNIFRRGDGTITSTQLLVLFPPLCSNRRLCYV